MGTAAAIQAALAALNGILGVIAEIRGQSGQNDDAILAAAQQTVGAGDEFYTTLMQQLQAPVTPTTQTAK